MSRIQRLLCFEGRRRAPRVPGGPRGGGPVTAPRRGGPGSGLDAGRPQQEGGEVRVVARLPGALALRLRTWLRAGRLERRDVRGRALALGALALMRRVLAAGPLGARMRASRAVRAGTMTRRPLF